MATYTLNVEVAVNQLDLLKESGYNLCLARNVNDTYTIVWSGNTKYLYQNVFKWTEEYQVFGQDNFTVRLVFMLSHPFIVTHSVSI